MRCRFGSSRSMTGRRRILCRCSIGAALTGSDAGSSAATHKGRRREAARCAVGMRQSVPSPPRTRLSDGVLGLVFRSSMAASFRHVATAWDCSPIYGSASRAKLTIAVSLLGRQACGGATVTYLAQAASYNPTEGSHHQTVGSDT